ncbi:hypothetical protein PSHT_03187 [Puccinia striiformis]|uniref:Uncharacterized protein n=1 Tax=Puccinia striiformis TaxID=27350 RepID=A0A2S4WFZ3_9BASI|nr:hypothetical protein PSHT_03187 [Puccinia striiformis]
MTCGASPPEAIPPAGIGVEVNNIKADRSELHFHQPTILHFEPTHRQLPRLHPTSNFLDTVQAAKMQFILATILAVSLLQGTLAAPAPIAAQTDTLKQAPSLDKRLYLGGGLGGSLLGTGFVGGYNGYSPLGYAPQYISTSSSGANSVYTTEAKFNTVPRIPGLTLTPPTDILISTVASCTLETRMNIPTFLNHISPNLLNSTPIPRPKPPTRPLIPINLISNPLGLSYDNDVLHRNPSGD